MDQASHTFLTRPAFLLEQKTNKPAVIGVRLSQNLLTVPQTLSSLVAVCVT